jgi:hypothetical protein
MTVERSLERLELYLERVKRNLASGDRASALANLAEVGEAAACGSGWPASPGPERKKLRFGIAFEFPGSRPNLAG